MIEYGGISMNLEETSIYYYSGTGNSYLVAWQMHQTIENSKIYNLLTYGREEIKSKAFVIIFPVHMYGVPPVVLEFINKLKVNSETFIYTVCTCAGIQGETMYHMDEVLKERQLHLAGGYVVKMPRTYIVEFKVQSKKKQLEILKEMKYKVANIAKEIQGEKQTFRLQKYKLSKWLYRPIYQRKIRDWNKQDSNFWTSSKCVGCGKCTRLCPVGNIELKDGKVTWKNQCLQCFRCVHGCPKEAIEYGKYTMGRRRYKNLELGNINWYKNSFLYNSKCRE